VRGSMPGDVIARTEAAQRRRVAIDSSHNTMTRLLTRFIEHRRRSASAVSTRTETMLDF